MEYTFFYWRETTRGNVKFGITQLPWQRLRMFQQGTDEEIQFDHLWLLETTYYSDFIESRLKEIYSDKCLSNTTLRAGHTEWFTNIKLEDFEKNLYKLAEEYHSKFIKIPLKGPYTATKSSQCPLGSPSNSRHQGAIYMYEWRKKFWDSLVKE